MKRKQKNMSYKINNTKLLVEAVAETIKQTPSGIFIPETIQQKKNSLKSVVLIAGKGTSEIEMIHKEGDTILHNPYSGVEFDWEGKKVKLIDQADVLLNLGQ